MKSLSIATLLMALCATQASAASLSVDQVGNVFSLYLNGFGFNGSFNAIQATITPAAPSTFSNINSGLNGLVPRSPANRSPSAVARSIKPSLTRDWAGRF